MFRLVNPHENDISLMYVNQDKNQNGCFLII
jgi:hypothetical protein